MNNEVKIFTDNLFSIEKGKIIYYRKPRHIEIINSINPDNGLLVTVDVECELQDSFIENIIDEAAAILASDMDNYNKTQNLTQNIEHNN